VIGLVRKPGEFPYPTTQEVRVLDALALLGSIQSGGGGYYGDSTVAESEGAVRIAVSLQGAKNVGMNLALAPGRPNGVGRQTQS